MSVTLITTTATSTVTTLTDHSTVPVTVVGDWTLMDTCAMVCYITKYYRLTSFSHTDTNECKEHSSGCTQICNNTLGSYFCSCYVGYDLDANNHTCNG